MVNAIGIDLGTSKCCVSVFRNGNVEIIPNEFGKPITPSYVAFTDTGPIIGDLAKDQAVENPSNTIFDILWLIGYDPLAFHKPREHYPFVADVTGTHSYDRVEVEVKINGCTHSYSPELLVSMLLIKLKESAEAFLESPVNDVVITVPVSLNYHYRHALLDAAEIAGLNVLRFVAAPEAAAIAYGFDVKTPEKRHVLVFDFGGGSLDYSILTFQNGKFEVLVTGSNYQLSGEHLDDHLFKHFAAEIERKNDRNVIYDTSARVRLLTACEQIKHTLFNESQATVELDNLIFNSSRKRVDFTASITQPFYEGICFDIFQKALDTVKEAMNRVNLRKNMIDDVILVGGCSRIPMVRQIISEYLGKEPLQTVNPDEAAATGAAIQAAILSDDKSLDIQNLLLPNVIPFTVGVEQDSGYMVSVIERNTVVPAANSKTISATLYDNMTEMEFKVFGGDNDKSDGNYCLGKIKFTDFPRPSPRDVLIKIQFSFKVDVNGILTVSAFNEFIGESSVLTAPKPESQFSDAKMKDLMIIAKELVYDEKLRRECAVVKRRLTDYCSTTLAALEENKRKRKLQEQQEQKVIKMCKKTLSWVNRNKTAKKEQLEEVLEEVENIGKDYGNASGN